MNRSGNSGGIDKLREKTLTDLDALISSLISLRDDFEKLFNYISKKPIEPISDGQKRYLMILYKKLNRKPPDNLDKLSRDDANKLINDLKKELGW